MRRMNARTLLFRNLQQFFEQHLAGLYTISSVIFEAPEMGEKIPRERQRHKECVRGMFGRWTISIESSVEAPPLGRITVSDGRGTFVTGPIDEIVWRRAAEMIKLQHAAGERALQNVN